MKRLVTVLVLLATTALMSCVEVSSSGPRWCYHNGVPYRCGYRH